MRFESLHQAYLEKFAGQLPTVASLAPGRVNLLGEHTDYNDGFVLPMAINAEIALLGGFNDSDQVQIYSLDYAQLDSFCLGDISFSRTQAWSNYLRGVCALLVEAGYSLAGMNIVLQGNVPSAAGLSSSAALEVATALFVNQLHRLDLSWLELIKLAQRAENEFVGVNCGIMDQFVSLLGQADHALFLDCRSLEYELVSAQFEDLGYVVVVIDSGVPRDLLNSEYNLRRIQCEDAVIALQKVLPEISALRDVSTEYLDLLDGLPRVLQARARHVITENERVLQGVQSLRKNDLKTFGALLVASHESLRYDFEVSCAEVDLLVELCQSVSGTLGARMTGAGFGGSMLALVAQEAVVELQAQVADVYEEKTGIIPHIHLFNAASGARSWGLG